MYSTSPESHLDSDTRFIIAVKYHSPTPPPLLCFTRAVNIAHADIYLVFPQLRATSFWRGRVEEVQRMERRGKGAGGFAPHVLLPQLSTGNSKLNCQKWNCPVINKSRGFASTAASDIFLILHVPRTCDFTPPSRVAPDHGETPGLARDSGPMICLGGWTWHFGDRN